jgi:2-haloacid dehalogenase
VPISQVCLVAAHAWDVTGALRAGCRAAFVARPGMVIDPLAPEAHVVGKDLAEVAERLVQLPGF